jgi:diaminohydroxyphosphoribosylaminopyrimidine deaminase / 5-amino-6-(5-phosphoribosylamino)uracil reductase
MTEAEDIKFMRRCIDLASKGEGMTYPNPMVGAVVVHEGIIVGEGYHIRSGEPHAEVNAINSVSDKTKLAASTIYVSLEPCSHFGKTPPCADLIIDKKIPRVVIGTTDTSDKVAGKGRAKLKSAGIDVTSGVLNDECRMLNRRFFTFHEKRRPYITLKWAQSADGFIDILRSENHKKEPTWISGKPERVLVHKWRAAEQSILVGAGTLRADNPKLNVREWTGKDPLKLILSGSGSAKDSLRVKINGNKTVVFTYNDSTDIPGSTVVILRKEWSSAFQICEYLYSAGIQSLFIEGGAEVLNHFISEGLWDEARVFKGSGFFREGVRAPWIAGTLFAGTKFSGSSLEIYLNNGTKTA